MPEPEHAIERPVALEAWPGGPRTPGVVTLAVPDAGQRIRSAAVAVGIGVALAVVFLPIPIVHFAGVPLALLAGLIVGARRLAPGARERAIRGPCPHCGHEQSYFLGPRWKRSGLPRRLSCEQCAAVLTAVEGEDGVAS
ncbi:MAG TPA: hypothetical protein VFY20_09455 [Gemmatimonadales bacterium]|nr:hypothetical protein [Gemmatimonadales bacterium]